MTCVFRGSFLAVARSVMVDLSPRLFSSDVRMLACRVDSDPRRGGACAKERFSVAERSLWLCPKRVAIFQSVEGGSLAGVSCAQPSFWDVPR